MEKRNCKSGEKVEKHQNKLYINLWSFRTIDPLSNLKIKNNCFPKYCSITQILNFKFAKQKMIKKNCRLIDKFNGLYFTEKGPSKFDEGGNNKTYFSRSFRRFHFFLKFGAAQMSRLVVAISANQYEYC